MHDIIPYGEQDEAATDRTFPFFPSPSKTTKGDGRIRGTEIPERQLRKTVPKPDRLMGEIQNVKITQFHFVKR